MDNSYFWFHLGCVMGSLARQDLQEYLAKEGMPKEQQDALRKQIMEVAKIAYKREDEGWLT